MFCLQHRRKKPQKGYQNIDDIRLAGLMWGHLGEEQIQRKALSARGPYSHAHLGFQKPPEFFFIPSASPESATLKFCLWIILLCGGHPSISRQYYNNFTTAKSWAFNQAINHWHNPFNHRKVKRKYAKRSRLSSTFKFQKHMNKLSHSRADLSNQICISGRKSLMQNRKDINWNR